MNHEKMFNIARKRGFLWPSFEIYSGVSGFTDYGPLGASLKNNIMQKWRKQYVSGEGFYEIEGPTVIHPSAADPYCPELRKLAIATGKELGIKTHETGTVVVVNGPRFSTKAESKFFTSQGWEVINMTAYPEAYLVKEMDMCPLNISLITDYDAGLVGDVPPVSHSEVIKVFNSNLDNLKKLLFTMIEKIDLDNMSCDCHKTSQVSGA